MRYLCTLIINFGKYIRTLLTLPYRLAYNLASEVKSVLANTVACHLPNGHTMSYADDENYVAAQLRVEAITCVEPITQGERLAIRIVSVTLVDGVEVERPVMMVAYPQAIEFASHVSSAASELTKRHAQWN